ncbi:collagen alpha-1(I) chain-like [Saccopteryx bilineata]|uniref:collagen alpha-1(I) chain-like n=1 Tax=Saccopteryx bilineata TaxID=59482 RepID=UPI00338F9BC3
MAREPGQRGAPPAGGRRAGPRRPLTPRTNPANNAPAQRAAQLPGQGPGRGTQRRRRRVGAAEGEACGRDEAAATRPRPSATCVRSHCKVCPPLVGSAGPRCGGGPLELLQLPPNPPQLRGQGSKWGKGVGRRPGLQLCPGSSRGPPVGAPGRIAPQARPGTLRIGHVRLRSPGGRCEPLPRRLRSRSDTHSGLLQAFFFLSLGASATCWPPARAPPAGSSASLHPGSCSPVCSGVAGPPGGRQTTHSGGDQQGRRPNVPALPLQQVPSPALQLRSFSASWPGSKPERGGPGFPQILPDLGPLAGSRKPAQKGPFKCQAVVPRPPPFCPSPLPSCAARGASLFLRPSWAGHPFHRQGPSAPCHPGARGSVEASPASRPDPGAAERHPTGLAWARAPPPSFPRGGLAQRLQRSRCVEAAWEHPPGLVPCWVWKESGFSPV